MPSLNHFLRTIRYRLSAAADERLTAQSFCAAGTGIMLGICFSALLINSIPVSMDPVEKAIELGITSKTTLAHYPKHRDVFAYTLGLFVTITTGTAVWILWAVLLASPLPREKNAYLPKNPEKQSIHKQPATAFSRIADHLLLPGAIIAYTFIPAFFFIVPTFWGFMAEEGLHLNAVTTVLKGGVLYRDIFYPYGPLMLYPVVFLMKLFSPDVVILRCFTYLLNVIAYLSVYYALRMLLTRRASIIAVFVLFSFFYFPAAQQPSGSILRFIIGMLPLIPIYMFLSSSKKSFLCISGFTAACALFFSQEAGIAAIVSVFTALSVHFLHNRCSLSRIIQDMLSLLLGGAVITLPIIYFFILNDALSPFLNDFFQYPQYVMMGHDSQPFPNIIYKLQSLLNNRTSFLAFVRIMLICYGPVLFYAAAGVYLLIRLLTSHWTEKDTIISGLLIFGIVYFRVALARPNPYKVLYCSMPAYFIALAYGSRLTHTLWSTIQYSLGLRKFNSSIAVRTLILSAMLIFVLGSFIMASGSKKNFIQSITLKFRNYFSIRFNNEGLERLALDRAENIYFYGDYPSRIRNVVKYIQQNTKPIDFVYAFPNEGMYNFLTHRQTPARFSLSYQAITSQMRIKETYRIRSSSTKYIVYTHDKISRVSGISEKIKAPEIVSFIKNNYQIEKKYQKTDVFKLLDNSP